MRETDRRQRRVPTLIGGLYDDAAVGAPSSSSVYLTGNPPRRVRPELPPPPPGKPVGLSAHSPVRAPESTGDEESEAGVRDSILAKVMEKFNVGPDSGGGAL
ncbi:hypothetical protein HOY82DRAFT_605752 [Tuber indicum]|nr:hypothetical protein HOY82DRAFT_605752 [Tuber indicum]